jgi:hypothetical protein
MVRLLLLGRLRDCSLGLQILKPKTKSAVCSKLCDLGPNLTRPLPGHHKGILKPQENGSPWNILMEWPGWERSEDRISNLLVVYWRLVEDVKS